MNLFTLLLLSLVAISTGSFAQTKGMKPIAAGTAPKGTERRVAVILANQDYQDNRLDLKKTYNDAGDMKTALERLGFDVAVFQKDVSRVALDRLLLNLGTKLRNYDVAFFYYSGHGSEYEGKNYLLPTDFPVLEYRSDIATYGISLDRVYKTLADAGIKTSIVVSDACRSLPMGKSAGLSTGMVLPTNNPSGTFTMFATRSGNLAQENPAGRNGYFTQELLKNMAQPNWTITKIFYETRKGVKAATQNLQDPSSANELDDDFVFAKTTVSSMSVAGTKVEPAVAKAEPTTGDSLANAEITEGQQAYKARDYSTAFRLLSTHTESLGDEWYYNLGDMYYYGRGVAKSHIQALNWYLKAAEQGYTKAQFDLGYMYENGQGAAKSNAQALNWYLKAAEQGHTSAQYTVGRMYHNGEGTAKDYAQAFNWFLKAAEQGSADAHNYIGVMYHNGEGVEKDYTQAFNWYTKADKLGSIDAISNLGIMYEHGLGVDKNEVVAAALRIRAILKKNKAK